MEKQEKKIIELMRDIKNKYPNEYYRMLGKMEGMKIAQSKNEA